MHIISWNVAGWAKTLQCILQDYGSLDTWLARFDNWQCRGRFVSCLLACRHGVPLPPSCTHTLFSLPTALYSQPATLYSQPAALYSQSAALHPLPSLHHHL